MRRITSQEVMRRILKNKNITTQIYTITYNIFKPSSFRCLYTATQQRRRPYAYFLYKIILTSFNIVYLLLLNLAIETNNMLLWRDQYIYIYIFIFIYYLNIIIYACICMYTYTHIYAYTYILYSVHT